MLYVLLCFFPLSFGFRVFPFVNANSSVLSSKNVMLIADIGFDIPNKFVVGYALDYNEYFRDLNVSFTLFLVLHI